MKTNVSNYKKDKYYPRVVKAIGQLLLKSDEIIPVEVMIEMGNLKKTSMKIGEEVKYRV